MQVVATSSNQKSVLQLGLSLYLLTDARRTKRNHLKMRERHTQHFFGNNFLDVIAEPFVSGNRTFRRNKVSIKNRKSPRVTGLPSHTSGHISIDVTYSYSLLSSLTFITYALSRSAYFIDLFCRFVKRDWLCHKLYPPFLTLPRAYIGFRKQHHHTAPNWRNQSIHSQPPQERRLPNEALTQKRKGVTRPMTVPFAVLVLDGCW